MKVVVCGDRYWRDILSIQRRLRLLPEDTLIITGGARGADEIADAVAKKLGLPTQIIEAKWEKYGDAAGPIRNREMLDLKPDLVIAFHPNLSKSKGTADAIREAKRRNIPVEALPK